MKSNVNFVERVFRAVFVYELNNIVMYRFKLVDVFKRVLRANN